MSHQPERRDYQIALKQQTYDAWAAGHRNVLNVLATGGGKSVVMSDIVLDGANLNHTQCVIAHRNELVAQMSAHIGRRGVPHRIIGSDATIAQIRRQHRALFEGQQFVHPTARTSVVGVDTLIARKDELTKWAYQHDHWMTDECFPAGTLITTDKGFSAIETLKVGDMVLAFNEHDGKFYNRKINRLFKNPMPNNMVRLTFNTHHVIETTCGHPFWTKRGWVDAANLTESDEVLYVSMFGMQDEYNKNNRESKVSFSQNWKSILLEKMWLCCSPETLQCEPESRTSGEPKGLSSMFFSAFTEKCKNLFKKMPGSHILYNHDTDKQNSRIYENEEEKSNALGRISEKNVRNSTENETQAAYAGWERKTRANCRTKIDRIFNSIRFSTSIRYKNWHEKGFRLSTLLQTRFSASSIKDSYRSRWLKSCITNPQRTGSQEGCLSKFVRLDSVEIFKSGNTGECERGSIYNIEVDEFHTYIANNIVVHNCHHVLRTNKWGKAVEMMPNALGSGFTATPVRADGQGLGREYDGVFDVMNIGPSMRELIERNYLSDFEIVCPRSDLQVSNEEVGASGDWSNKTLRKAAKKSHIVGDVVENYCKYAFGRRAIVFATDVETAGEIAQKFNEWQIPAASLSALTPAPVREKYIADFKSGKISVLINVDLFDEGFDVPACDVVIMARPTASFGKYRQMVGRALRYVIGKIALIIDMVSNVIRHGLPDKDIAWTLARRDKRAKQIKDPDDIPLTVCASPTCAKPYERFRTVCPHCGMEKPLPSPRERSLEMVEGDLILLDRATLEKMRAGTILENPGDIASRVTYAAGQFAGMAAAKRQVEKIEAHGHLREVMAQWAGIERARGFNDREIQRKFYHVTGMDVVTALDASRPASEMNSLRSTIEGWWRR